MLPRQMSMWTWTRDNVGEGGALAGVPNHHQCFYFVMAIQSELFG